MISNTPGSTAYALTKDWGGENLVAVAEGEWDLLNVCSALILLKKIFQ
jgi:hypothetical protein